jgi:hypothetical protein
MIDFMQAINVALEDTMSLDLPRRAAFLARARMLFATGFFLLKATVIPVGRRESSPRTFANALQAEWIPAFAGTTIA